MQEGAAYNANAVARNFHAEDQTYDEIWDRGEVQPHQEDHDNDDDNQDKGEHDEPTTKTTTTVKPWKAVFLRHYLLRYRWLYGCEPQPGGNTKAKPSNSVMRGVVAGMKSSGKSHFLRTLAPDQHVSIPPPICAVSVGRVPCVPCVPCVSCYLHSMRSVAGFLSQVEDGGCNVVVIVDNGRRMALLEMRRPNSTPQRFATFACLLC